MKTYPLSNIAQENGDILIPISESVKKNLADHAVLNELNIASESLFIADFISSESDVRTLYHKKRRLIFLKLGKEKNGASYLLAFRRFVKKNQALLTNLAALALVGPDEEHEKILSMAFLGFYSGTYDGGLYKQARSLQALPLTDIRIYSNHLSAETCEQLTTRARHIAEVQMSIMDLMNTPGNKKSAQTLAEWAVDSSKTWHYTAEIYDLDWIKEQGMHAIEAVNRGSETPAKFLVLRYEPGTDAIGPKIGLIGKGITYDTGGLSIKPSDSMIYMKSDMGGAAAVFGTIELAARLALPVRLVAAIPVTDNLVDALAIKPGDVIGSYSGKSIEVLNTDAEGRLILADALCWMVRHEKPDHMIDLATLTGAAVRSLGYSAAALMGNDQNLIDQLIAAGEKSGERLWPFPLWDDYLDELQSDVADLRNIGLKPIAGQIIAGKFLEQFIENHSSWAHIDIAGTAFGDTEFGKNKNATAYGVRLLLEFLESIAKQNT